MSQMKRKSMRPMKMWQFSCLLVTSTSSWQLFTQKGDLSGNQCSLTVSISLKPGLVLVAWFVLVLREGLIHMLEWKTLW